MNTTKKCNTCQKTKPFKSFSKNRNKKYGLCSQCKKCVLAYQRSKSGLIAKIYSNQRSKSRFRNHPMPEYTLEDLKTWIINQPIFHKLYKDWKESGYQYDNYPSIDRKENSKGYSFSNIQLMTWAKNRANACSDQKKGKLSRGRKYKTVVQYSLNGERIAEFFSTNEASRKTGISQGNISTNCNGKRPTAGGFKWTFK